MFLLLFFSRLTFGLCEAKWWGLDELQTYLIGLKCYTTGTWPYFGPDVTGNENTSFERQLPGALEGLLIGLPLRVLPFPETPTVVVTFLSTVGAALLAWYIRRRIPGLSFPWLFAWICVTPWSVSEGTHVINPAFNYLPSVLFFVGFMESLPYFSTGWLGPLGSNALMGFSVAWIMQFHFSYVYLAPLAGFSLLSQWWKGNRWRPFVCFAAGAAPMAALILPTLLKYGLNPGNEVSAFAAPFFWNNFTEWVTILARFFSLACYEVPRFIGQDNHERFQYLAAHPFLALPCAFLWMGGILQALVMLLCWFKMPSFLYQRKWYFPLVYVGVWGGIEAASGWPPYAIIPLAALLWFAPRVRVLAPAFQWFRGPADLAGWKEMNLLVVCAYLVVWVSFWFTIKLPMSHIYFILYPLVMTYSCYCWRLFAGSPRLRLLAKVFILAGVYFQFGYAFVTAKFDSLYQKREPLARAIQEKNYHLAGERRPNSLY